ncbi:hypothetical protein WCX72_09840 [Sulfurimonas sp. HSL1-6]|uniref:hypothetical protein n=1 Tax=Thiomicrolovo immobilis TaxID=3131935 RepID=UPI0031F9A48B
MKTVKVDKDNLLKVLRENREKHQVEFDQLWGEFQTKIKDEITRISMIDEYDDVPSIQAIKPESFVKDYDEVIGMLEFSTDTEFDITQEEYKKYVLNEWDWKRTFDFIKTSYGY